MYIATLNSRCRADSCTELGIKACTWLREISSCSCLTVVPGPVWLLLNKICIPLFRALYSDQWAVPTTSYSVESEFR